MASGKKVYALTLGILLLKCTERLELYNIRGDKCIGHALDRGSTVVG